VPGLGKPRTGHSSMTNTKMNQGEGVLKGVLGQKLKVLVGVSRLFTKTWERSSYCVGEFKVKRKGKERRIGKKQKNDGTER